MPVWFKIAIGGHMALLVGMGLGRFSVIAGSYMPPMVPALTGAGSLERRRRRQPARAAAAGATAPLKPALTWP